ncbi:MAG TPA: uroporphyrinogen decarboxylase family protein, partial [Armatimonadota bacterium]
LDVEMVACGDDLGTQHSALLNPELFEEFFVPEYTRLFDLYHEHGMLINFHSCGNILPMLDIFLRLGIHILNPLQAEANDLAHIRERTQGKMALHGAVSTRTIMDGPPERITAEVRQRLWELGRDGGYFCAPDQGMPFPPEHLAAYQQALEEYGRYPLMEYPGEIRHC